MPNDDREFSTRSKMNRGGRNGKKKKLDRLLNVLIAIVAVLIVINGYFIFSKNDNETSDDQTNEQLANKDSEDTNKETEEDESGTTEPDNNQNEESQPSNDNASNLDSNHETQSGEHTTTKLSNDAIVEEVIINENWQPTPTKQTGEHKSTYQEGHIDYEEKLETFRNAVNLPEENIIFWSVRNNGSSNSSIAVVSSKDQSEKYRVSIEWVENQGWKPVKVEKLNQLEGAYAAKD